MSSFGALNFPQIDAAIGGAEGYGQPGAIPTLANNPGDLVLGDQGLGTLGQGITVFPTPQAGATALDNQVTKMANGTSSVYAPNESIAQIGQTYAGANGGSSWAANVAKSLGISPSSSLFSFLNNNAGIGSNSTTSSGLGARIAAGFIGMLVIAAGLFMLKSTQTVIQTGGSIAKKAVELSA